MNRNKVRKGRFHQRPAFISKLFQMVEDSSIQPVFGWTPSGDSFNIKSVTKFTEEVLPKYFKHKNFSSFVRQLNMYGFHKIRHEDGQNVYKNEHFRMGGRHQLRNISRRIKEEKEETVAIVHEASRQKGDQKQLTELKGSQKKLEQLLKGLMRENQKLTEEHQNMIRKYEYTIRLKERRMQEFLLMLLSRKSIGGIGNGADQILQINNGQQSEQSQNKSPIEVLSTNLQQSEHYPKVRRIMDYIYGRLKRRQEHPQGDNNQSVSDMVSQMSFAIRSQINQRSIHLQRDDDDGYISVNSFLDIQEFDDHIDLEESK